MAQSFAAATAVHRVATDSADAGARAGELAEAHATYESFIHDGWDIHGNANGGYLLAIVGRALVDRFGRPPVTVTAHYLAPGLVGPARVEITTVRSGRSFTTATAELFSGDRKLMQVLASLGEAPTGGFEYRESSPPDVPEFDDPAMLPSAEIEAASPSIFANIDARLTPESAGFRLGNPSGRAVVEGWFDLRTEEPIDRVGLLLVADAFPPPIFNTNAPEGWIPTLELTVHLRAEPVPGPLRCRFVSDYASDGFVGEDGEVWDASGRLVCESRQLALLPRPQLDPK